MLEGAKSFVVALIKGTGGRDRPDDFTTVCEAERREIDASRAVRYAPGETPPDARSTYVGLALSGGGIRSATFSLGLLQGLHRLGVLRAVDYLSTVSGGGFTGSWWTAWLNREHPASEEPGGNHFPPGELREPQRAPDFAKREDPPDGARSAGVDPIHHLRLFANYITPRKGLLSGDTWRAAAVLSRNLVLTWLVLLPILCGVVLLGQLYYVVQPFDDEVAADFVHASATLGTPNTAPTPDRALHEFDGQMLWQRVLAGARLPLALLVLMAWVTALWMHFNNDGKWYAHLVVIVALLVIVGAAVVVYEPGLENAASSPGAATFQHGHFWDLVLAAATVIAGAAIAVSIHRSTHNGTPVARQVKANRATRWQTVLLATFSGLVLVLTFAGFAHEFLVGAVLNVAEGNLATWKEKATVVGTLASVASTIFSVFVSAPTGGRDRGDLGRPSLGTRVVLAITPLLALLMLGAAAALAMHWVMYDVLVVDKRLPPLAVSAWASLALALFLAGWENEQIAEHAVDTKVPRLYAAATVVLLALVSLAPWLPGWWSLEYSVYSRSAGIALALAIGVGLLWPAPRSARVRALLAFIVAFLLAWMVIRLPGFDDVWASGLDGNRSDPLQIGLAVVAGLAGWILALGWMADPNALSLHTFYRARLVRAYLGASNGKREERGHDIAEPDRDDDMRLMAVRNSRYGGPYPLINTTLNLVGGRDLVTAQRWAASFTLAPLYCGSMRTGYRPTAGYMDGCLTLGAAVATSGAAVSPNMGSATPSAALALLLSAFNIRLGLWVPTPSRMAWMLPQTRLWPFYLLRESLSQTNDVSTYCYLTDGGHFDNSGLYSLVERGCRYIILADNGADPERCFADVGEAIRRCRIDFRAEIELDTQTFRPAGDQPGTVHVTYGRIRYDADHLRSLGWTKVDGDDAVGRFVWIKPTVLPDDAADVRQYRLENDKFPQQTTADQWFDESQFESYRKLGELSADAAFGAAADTVPLMVPHDTGVKPRKLTRGLVRQLFEAVGARPPAACVTPAGAPSVPTSAR